MAQDALLDELRRLTLARDDIECALDGCQRLEQQPNEQGMQWGQGTWTLWTGIVVSYCRPFKNAGLHLKDTTWQSFEDAELQRRHDGLVTLRDKLFAHNDVRSEREVVIFPPHAWTPSGRATLRQAVFNVEDATETPKLCEFQIARLANRIDRLVETVCGGREFDEGAIITLDDLR